MTRPLILAALVALPVPALALTPEELFASWQARAAEFDVTLSAATATEGDALVLRDVALAFGEEEPDVLPFPVTLRPGADGSVAVEVPIPSFQDIPGDAGMGQTRVEQRGAAITARDGAGEGVVDYEVAAEMLRLAALPGVDEPDSTFTFALEMEGARVTFSDRPDAAGLVRGGLAADGVAYVLDTTDPYAGTTSGSTRIDGVSMDVAVTVPPGFDVRAFDGAAPGQEGLVFARALRDGLAVSANFASGATEGRTSASGGFFDYDYAVTGGPSTASLSLDAEAFGVTAEGGTFTATGSLASLGLGALEATIGPYDMDILVPLGATPSPFRYRVALEEVSISDAAWDAFDPEGTLPREPARFVVDVTGEAALDVVAMMEAEAKVQPPPVPAITSLEVAAFEVAAAGARATATGSFTFTQDASGIPTPVGAGTATLEGASRLIDALVSLGAIPQSEAGNVRMGLAMGFEATGDDVLTAEVEARADGTIVVNGQPITP